jgi:hypothetical protein
MLLCALDMVSMKPSGTLSPNQDVKQMALERLMANFMLTVNRCLLSALLLHIVGDRRKGSIPNFFFKSFVTLDIFFLR